VQWAHPDFGTIIATCSYDRSINIWEEVNKNPYLLDQTEEVQSDHTQWQKLTTLPTMHEPF